MLRELAYPPHQEYRTGSAYEPLEFYVNMLMNSNRLDLLLGYFSSSAISLLSLGFAKFITSGGSMRIIINNVLSPKDKEAILRGEHTDEEEFDFSVEKYEMIKESLDSYGTHFFECLSWLISSKRVQIVAIKPINKKGISHYKSGIFSDGTNKVKFKGSVNFTAYGLAENLEELGIQTSWKDEAIVFDEYETYFEKIITNQSEHARVIDFSEIESRIVNDFGDKNLEELLINEEELLKSKKKLRESKSFSVVMEDAEEQINYALNSPKFPFNSEPREYQKQAYINWVINDRKGIFAMATGTGKTITALNCLLNEYNESGVYRALILVPTESLVKQWVSEVASFNFKNVTTVSSKTNWQSDLSKLSLSLTFSDDISFIIIATYASFYRKKFQYFASKLPKNSILIADEAHNIASPKVKAALPHLPIQKRIALSATPKRIYDVEGSIEMEDFFNDKEPYTYSYSMEEAIKNGILTQYNYHPVVVMLNTEELEEYKKITLQIVKYFDAKTGGFRDPKKAEMLLLKRKRIIHKAANKLQAFEQIIKKEFDRKGNLKYTFVYVPEGFTSTDNILDIDAAEEQRIIYQYNRVVMDVSENVRISSFLGDTPDKDEVIRLFKRGEIDVLTSMKCLDEGVDIPRTEVAIFCSSTGNPRQFIQRRGRVLRDHGEKTFATVYDLVVIPTINENTQSDTFALEKSLVRKELERVAHFAFMAINQFEAINSLQSICTHYQLNLHEINDTLN
jgi:superfamily II DNA or RNA helicase